MNRTSLNLSVLLCFTTLIAVGCGGPEYEGAKRFAVKGTVTVDGEPMDYGTISFIPSSEAARVSGGPIVDGKFEMREGRGANAGQYRVEIRWQKPTGKKYRDPDTEEMMDERKEGLPKRYHEQSELTADVSEENHTFDFALTTNDE